VLDQEKFEIESNIIAIKALKFSIEKITEENIKFIQGLPKKIESTELNITMAHGTITGPSVTEYTADEYQFQKEFSFLNTRIGLLGHTHIPLIYNGKMFRKKECTKKIITKHQSKVIINPGSVGQPRDWDTRASYGIIDIEKSKTTVYIKKVPYNINITTEAIKKANLPPSLASRLNSGK